MDNALLLFCGVVLPLVLLQAPIALFDRAESAFSLLGRSARRPASGDLSVARIFGEEGEITAFDRMRLPLPVRADYGAYGGPIQREALAICLLYQHLPADIAKTNAFMQEIGEKCR